MSDEINVNDEHFPIESDKLTYTVVNPHDNSESKLHLDYHFCRDGNHYAELDGRKIGPQQLAELGMLLFAVANDLDPNFDIDSVIELLDGFDLIVPEARLAEVTTKLLEAEENA